MSESAGPGQKHAVISVIEGVTNNDDGAGVVRIHAANRALSGAAVSAQLAARSKQPG